MRIRNIKAALSLKLNQPNKLNLMILAKGKLLLRPKNSISPQNSMKSPLIKSTFHLLPLSTLLDQELSERFSSQSLTLMEVCMH